MSAAVDAIPVPFPDPLTRAREGDQEAFETLIREHEAMVFSIALRTLGNRSAAEEVAQEVFLALYRNLDRIDSSSHLRFWLRRTTGHRCIDEIRRHPLQRVALDDAPEIQSAPDGRDLLLERMLRALIGELRPEQRLVLTLRYQEELEPAEIARVLGLRLQTVKSQLHRGLRRLRKRLSEEEDLRGKRHG